MANKNNLRDKFKQSRKILTKDDVKSKSLEVANNLLSNVGNKIPNLNNKKLAFYIAANNEVDTSVIIDFAEKQGSIISLPLISHDNKKLVFKRYSTNDPLKKNNIYAKLLEPLESKEDVSPEIVFVPLVVFDNNCNRIGMGGGFYDRAIHNMRQNSQNTIFIGLAYDSQLCDGIDVEDTDESLDFIVSQSDIYTPNKAVQI